LNEKVEGNTLADTNREVDIVADKGGAGDLTRTKGRKRRMSNEDTWTSKKSKVSVPMRMPTQLTFEKKGTGLPYQVSCWEETVNGEDICKGYLVT
jgi:hypothetical protein